MLRVTYFSYSFQVARAEYLSGRSALHFAAMNGHVRCIRLVVADFVPSAPFDSINVVPGGEKTYASNIKSKYDQRYPYFSNRFMFIFQLSLVRLQGYAQGVEYSKKLPKLLTVSYCTAHRLSLGKADGWRVGEGFI